MINESWWRWYICLIIYLINNINALTIDEVHRLSPAIPVVMSFDKNQNINNIDNLILLEEEGINGPKVDVSTPGVHDMASDVIFKHFKGVSGKVDVPKIPYLPWHKKKEKYFGATMAMKPDDLGIKDPKIDKKSAQLADPSTIKRECPREQCPKDVKCAGKNMHCCKTGNFTFCCPNSATCVATDPPTCLTEPADDPNACTEEFCKTGFHCPLSRQAACCIGGTHCCPYNSKCMPTNPPTCKRLPRWTVLTKKQIDPIPAIRGIPLGGNSSQLTRAAVPFTRLPYKVIPMNRKATPAPKPKPTPNPINNTTNTTISKQNITTNNKQRLKIPEIPCPQCDKSLFPKPPTEAGTRTRQKAFIINDPNTGKRYKILITEIQDSKFEATGELRTKTRRVKSVYQLPKNDNSLYPSDGELGSHIATALHRMKIATKAGMKGVDALKAHEIHRDHELVKLKSQLKRTKAKLKKVLELKKIIPTISVKGCGCSKYKGVNRNNCMKACREAHNNFKPKKFHFITETASERKRRLRLAKQQMKQLQASHQKRMKANRRLVSKNVA